MSIHDRTQSIWEELVRIREVMALDSYARQLRETEKDLGSLDKVPAKGIKKHAEHVFALAEEMDKVRTDMKKRAYPMEHL
mgnify:CR=1 FL=1|jgi:hypothetical protein